MDHTVRTGEQVAAFFGSLNLKSNMQGWHARSMHVGKYTAKTMKTMFLLELNVFNVI